MRLVKRAGRPRRVAGQDRHRVVARHRAAGSLEDLFGHTTSFINNQHHVVAVDTGQRFGLLGPRRSGRDECFRRCGDQFDAVGLRLDQTLQRRRQFVNPPLQLGEQGVVQLRAGRRRDHHLARIPKQQEPNHGPAKTGCLAGAVARPHANLPLAAADRLQQIFLIAFRHGAEYLTDKQTRPVLGQTVPRDHLLERVFTHHLHPR